MGIKHTWNELDKVRHEINDLKIVDRKSVSSLEGLKTFGSRAVRTVKLMLLEKELIVFALLQWASVAIGYLLWVQMLDWIPEEVWRSTKDSDEGSIADIVLLLWSFVCVGVAAFPLALSTACMGAVHFINKQGKESTIASCLQIVLPKAWSLWIFHWIDGWVTVNQILERLPKERKYRKPAALRVLSEASYYAWKIGTMGILPGLITGRGMFQSGKDSVQLITKKFKDIALLRAGYSAICWVVGIATYIGSIFFLFAFDVFPKEEDQIYGYIFTIYLWLAVPILIAVAFLQLFVRPIYILSLCDLYSDFLEESGQDAMLPPPPSKGVSAIIALLILCTIVAVVFWFRYELGIMDMLATKYGEGYAP